MTGGPDRRQRWMTLALRAFPKRWRAANGEEFLATTAQLQADGLAPWLALELFETLLAGFDVRLRTRPPLRHRIAYHYLWRPVPTPWHGWMRDDLSSRWVGLRFMLWGVLFNMGTMGTMMVATDGVSSMPPWFLPWYFAVTFMVLLSAPLQTRRVRRYVSRKAGWTRVGATLPPPPPPSPPDSSTH